MIRAKSTMISGPWHEKPRNESRSGERDPWNPQKHLEEFAGKTIAYSLCSCPKYFLNKNMVPFPFLQLINSTTPTASKKLMGVAIQNPDTVEVHQLFIMVREVLQSTLKFDLHPEPRVHVSFFVYLWEICNLSQKFNP